MEEQAETVRNQASASASLRSMKTIFALAAAMLLLVTAAPASACSVTDGYRVPTNFELVEQADLILLGEIESAPETVKGLDTEQMIVRPIEVLKGGPVAGTVKVAGMAAPPRFAVKSDPNELENAHPLAYIGGCIRYMFVPHSTVLFVLRHSPDGLIPSGSAFSRWAEDVPSPGSRWMKAVRIYMAIAALPEPNRRAALEAKRKELAASTDDSDAQAIAADVARSLKGNRRWNDIMREAVERMH